MIQIIYLLLLFFLTEGRHNSSSSSKIDEVNDKILYNLDKLIVNQSKVVRNMYYPMQLSTWQRRFDRTDYKRHIKYYQKKVRSYYTKLIKSFNEVYPKRDNKYIVKILNENIYYQAIALEPKVHHGIYKKVSQSTKERLTKKYKDAQQRLKKLETFTDGWLGAFHGSLVVQHFYRMFKNYKEETEYKDMINRLGGYQGQYNVCAKENQTCRCKGEVRYGAKHKWSKIKKVRSSITCNNKNFGDIFRGTSKSCICKLPKRTRISNRRFMSLIQEEQLKEVVENLLENPLNTFNPIEFSDNDEELNVEFNNFVEENENFNMFESINNMDEDHFNTLMNEDLNVERRKL